VQTPAIAILSFGLRPEALFPEQAEVSALIELSRSESAELLPRALADAIEGGRHAIAIAPRWLKQGGPELFEAASSALETTRVALHQTLLPPLAGGVLVSMAATLASRAPSPGSLLAALPNLERELHVFAWLRSVSGLTEPAPTVLQHLASHWPSTAFVVSSWPEPSVHRLSPRHATVPVPELEAPIGLAIAAEPGEDTWIERIVAPALGDPELRRVAPTPLAEDWWGSRDLVESVAFPDSADLLSERFLAPIELAPCRWCQELIASVPCPFCGSADPARAQR
jgi:hypothetical protein